MKKRIISIFISIILVILTIASAVQYAFGAGSYNTLGTNKALGSPILNSDFSVDDWNKWEMIAWGVFLSNFTTPFVDDYNSAFNIDAGYGSKGSGVKALQFGSGQDVNNSSTIRDLVDYAINQQRSGAVKNVYVTFSSIEDGIIKEKSTFGSNTLNSDSNSSSIDNADSSDNSTNNEDADSEDSDTENNESNNQGQDDNVPGNTSSITNSIRQATVKDLIFANKKPNGTDAVNSTWADAFDNKSMFQPDLLKANNYADFVGTKEGCVPTFAVSTLGGNYEIIFDYTDAYDLSVISAVIAKGLIGDFKDIFVDTMNKVFKEPENYKLVMDCFGNLCTQINGSYMVIVPAAANKYLTSTPSINLANSLFFNSNSTTIGSDNLILSGGQGTNGWVQLITDFATNNFMRSGVPAFSSNSANISSGNIVMYYDTDTIVMQDALQRGNLEEYDVNIGDVIKKLYDLDINSGLNNQYGFKIEPCNFSDSNFNGLDSEAKEALQNIVMISGQLINLFPSKQDAKMLTELKTDTKDDLKIFGDPVIVPVTLPNGVDKKNVNEAGVYRAFANWVFQMYRKGMYESTVGTINSENIISALNQSQTIKELGDNLISASIERNNTQGLSTLSLGFIASRNDFYSIKNTEALKNVTYDPGDIKGVELSRLGVLNHGISENILEYKLGKNLSATNGIDAFGRSVKVYPTSEVMRSIANILGVREGTEFGVFSMYIYMTYLDWYGITAKGISSLSNTKTSNFNTRIFDENSDVLKADITTIADVTTEEQKEKEIMNWTYMMLNPTSGREYRSKIILSAFSDWIYDNYQKVVYGNSSSYYQGDSGVTSRNSTGFMTVSTYADNFMTAWLINNYSFFAVIMIAAILIATIVMGLIKKHKVSWFFITIFVGINMVLLLPSTGEIVPLISNNMVQDLFKDKMGYWAISESVTNSTMEADYVNGTTLSTSFMGSMSKSEQSQVISMVKNLNTLYVDRSLNVKQDISKKVTQTQTGNFEEIQQLRTARWMLPMIMRQFSATDGSANYVYVPLGDLYDDVSNMYWYFKPTDAAFVSTVNAKQVQSTDGSQIPSYTESTDGLHDVANRTNYYAGYIDTLSNGNIENYRQQSYTKNSTNLVHTYSYMIDEKMLLNTVMPDYSNYESYDEWAKAYTNQLMQMNDESKLKAIESHIESVAGDYSRFDRGSIRQIYGYLWATENPLHYFYEGVKDSFESDSSLGSLVGDLQGTYVINDATGIEVRKSFMHADETGYIKDVLDLEEMFTNMIPYMYSLQLYAEGYDDIKGVFADDEMIQDYKVYKGNNKSWLFRSNWITKLMENKSYNGEAKVRLSDGTSVTVKNMMLPSCYEEAGRKMVFSEAQMYQQGLDEADLSLVELKCVKINKDTSRSWTMLLNYVGVNGITKEVMMRQMALDALMNFNSEFSPSGIFGAAYEMYPSSIDLRAISFDSVMKMLLLNVTHDASYIYGDTMKTLVEDSDIITSFMLLATAFTCAFLIPLFRNVVLGFIFFLGIFSLGWSIMKDMKTKSKVSCGFVISNLVFLIATLTYFGIFKAIMAMTTTDEVLSVSQIEVNTGNPVWCMIFILAISIAYCVALYKILILCMKNYRDMGFEVYASVAGMVTSRINGAIERATSSSKSSTRRASRGRKSEPVQVINADEIQQEEENPVKKRRPPPPRSSSSQSDRVFSSGEYTDTTGRVSGEIDREIDRGRQISREEQSK